MRRFIGIVIVVGAAVLGNLDVRVTSEALCRLVFRSPRDHINSSL